MSINKFVPIAETIFQACEDIGVDTAGHERTMTLWAYKAEKKIGDYYSFIKEITVLDVDGCTVKLPDATTHVQALLLGDQGCKCGDLIKGISNFFPSGSFITDNGFPSFLVVDVPGGGSSFTQCLPWEIQDNQIIFAEAPDIDKVTVQILRLKEDSNGNLLVNENHAEAVAAFIKMRYAERSRFTTTKMDLADVRRLGDKWKDERAMAIAASNVLSPTQREEIAFMLNDPWSGRGMLI